MAHPKSATFRTGDMVGIDTLAHVADNCYEVLTDDEDREVFALPDYIRTMVEQKQLGNKTRGGFYKKTKAGIETLDPTTGEYRPRGGNQELIKACKAIAKEPDPRERVREAGRRPTARSAQLRLEGAVAQPGLRRAAGGRDQRRRRPPSMTPCAGATTGSSGRSRPGTRWASRETVRPHGQGRHRAARAGRARCWRRGVDSFYDGQAGSTICHGRDYARARARPARGHPADPAHAATARCCRTSGAEAWDLGDGVLGLTFKTKANSIDPDVIAMLDQAVERAERDFRAHAHRQPGRALLRRRQPVPGGHGGRAEAVGASCASWSHALPGGDPAHEVRAACRWSRRPTA